MSKNIKPGKNGEVDDATLLQVLNFIGIANQLAVTRANQMLAEGSLPFQQFVMLSHFAKDPERPRTVTGIASAFQAPQPGITKTVQKMVRRGYLETRPDAEDGRSRQLFMTKAGAGAFAKANAALAPLARKAFADWPEADILNLHRLLHRLKDWLDENRDG